MVLAECTVAMLFPSQLLPPASEAQIRPEGTADKRAEKPSVAVRPREATDEFAALFAALACPAQSAPATMAAPVESGDDTLKADGCAAAVADAAPDAALPSEPFIALSDPPASAALPAPAAQIGSDAPPPTSVDAAGAATPGPSGQPSGGPDGLIVATDGQAGPAQRPTADMPVQVIIRAAGTPPETGARGAKTDVPDAAATSFENAVDRHRGGDPVTGSTVPEDNRGDAKDGGNGTGKSTQQGTARAADAALAGADATSAASLPPHQKATEGQSIPGAPAAADRATSSGHHVAELIRHSLPQVADAARHGGHGTVEIALSPEELGHVRLAIQSDDGTMATVRLSADRHETLDLMRRHVELLAQDMRDLGFRDISFSFQHGPQRGPSDFNGGPSPSLSHSDHAPGPDGQSGVPASPARYAGGGLDLRL